MLLLILISLMATTMSFKLNRFNTITIKKINKISINCDCGSDSSSDSSSCSDSYSDSYSSSDNYYTSDYSSDNYLTSDYSSNNYYDDNVFINTGKNRKRSPSSTSYVSRKLTYSMITVLMVFLASQIHKLYIINH